MDLKTIENELNKTSLNGQQVANILEFLQKNEAKIIKELNKDMAIITKKLAFTHTKTPEIWADKTGEWLTNGEYAILKSYCKVENVAIEQKDFNTNCFKLNENFKYELSPLNFEVQKESSKVTSVIYNTDDFAVKIDKKYYDAFIKPFIYTYDISLKVNKPNDMVHVFDNQNKKVIAVIMPRSI